MGIIANRNLQRLYATTAFFGPTDTAFADPNVDTSAFFADPLTGLFNHVVDGFFPTEELTDGLETKIGELLEKLPAAEQGLLVKLVRGWGRLLHCRKLQSAELRPPERVAVREGYPNRSFRCPAKEC